MAVVVLDNGAGFSKIGFSTDGQPRNVPNCVSKAKNVRTRIFIGDQIEDCKDLSGLYYLLPFQKGYLVNWEIEKQVWDYLFSKDVLKVNFSETTLVVTEPHFNFLSIQEAMNEIFFEDYQFQAIYRTNASRLSDYRLRREQSTNNLCSLIIDSGYSFSHLVPYMKGKKITNAVKRINVGGKILTNHLKEIISYRQLMVMDETYVINQLKEDVCFVSQDFSKDMETARLNRKDNSIGRDYILPDYTNIHRGYMNSLEESTGKSKENEQLIRVNNERFSVPEILFHPSNVGIEEMGIAETVAHILSLVSKEMEPHLLNNILLTGGNCFLPGFKERFVKEVRSMIPIEYDLRVTMPDNPQTYAWHGGAKLASDPKFSSMVVTKQQYEEYGHSICADKFNV
ncbi:actin-related protein 6 [Octopus bimaculoides]|uniref:Actin-related protein 6 n=1 Tax=Octopus bimaculoides TaxID=37653 RepID=A0A0L8GBL5_OCTBM|nr:actin-related protein 6 [Octopus bimaculoides]|eukprot:XP_014782503.1 PREDICTED: actin-related protein 6-like isoform X1 [Octopus bimaculoides]